MGNEVFGNSIKRDLKGFIWNDDSYIISSEVEYEEVKYGEGYNSFSISRGIFKFKFIKDIINNTTINSIRNIEKEIYDTTAYYILNNNIKEYENKLEGLNKEIKELKLKINNYELFISKETENLDELLYIKKNNKLLKNYNYNINKQIHINASNDKKVKKHRNIGIGTFIPGFILLSGGGTGLGFTSYYIYQSNNTDYKIDPISRNLLVLGCTGSCLLSITGFILTIISIANFGRSLYYYNIHRYEEMISSFNIIYNNNTLEFSFKKRLFL
jgi:hypothetical protein